MPYSRRLIHVDGSALGDFRGGAIPCGPRGARPLARKPAARFGYTKNAQPEAVEKAARVAERPIAPENVSCPSPPWDMAFSGAFFARRRNRADLVPTLPTIVSEQCGQGQETGLLTRHPIERQCRIWLRCGEPLDDWPRSGFSPPAGEWRDSLPSAWRWGRGCSYSTFPGRLRT